MAKFEVGDKVQITSRWGAITGTSVVAQVLKTRLVLENGTRYDLEGYALSATHSRCGTLAGSIRKIVECSRCGVEQAYETCDSCNKAQRAENEAKHAEWLKTQAAN